MLALLHLHLALYLSSVYLSSFPSLWIVNTLPILLYSSISITSTVPEILVEGISIREKGAVNVGILDERRNLIYSQRSVTMRGNRVNLILNTFYSPLRNTNLLGASSQEANITSVRQSLEPSYRGLHFPISSFFHSCLKGLWWDNRKLREQESWCGSPQRKYMWPEGSQPSLWLRQNSPEIGARRVRMQKEGVNRWPTDEVPSYSVVSVRVPAPTNWVIWEKYNKETLLKSVVGCRKAIGVVLCPGVGNSRGITTLSLRARQGVGKLETEKLSDRSRDFNSRDIASPWQPWSKVAEEKNYPNFILPSPSNLLLSLPIGETKQSHRARKLIDVIHRSQPPRAQSRV